MKSKIFISIPLAAIAVSVLFNACKKDDTTPPVVTLTGNSSMNLVLNAALPSDPGATANDDKDGSVTVTSDWSSTNPNKDAAGTYTITYSATDKAGNTGTATRTVTVKNDAAYLEGSYNDSIYTYNGTIYVLYKVIPQTITASTAYNNRIVFSKLGDYLNNNSVYAQVTGAQVDLPTSETITGIGSGGCTHVFAPGSGSGNPIVNSSGKYSFSLKYSDEQKAGGGGCTAAGPDPIIEVFFQ